VFLDVGAPIYFKQDRPGFKGRRFSLIKYRTMISAEFDSNGNRLSDAQRITRIGQFLRSTSLDELPELWNVLKGEMSLVGPRPLLMEYMDLYSVEQHKRHNVLPGLTGWAQVNGRNEVSWDEKFRMDLWYVENQSFLLDVRILLLTIKSVLRREGISQKGRATTDKFSGNGS